MNTKPKRIVFTTERSDTQIYGVFIQGWSEVATWLLVFLRVPHLARRWITFLKQSLWSTTLEAWHINVNHYALNRDDGSYLSREYLHLVGKWHHPSSIYTPNNYHLFKVDKNRMQQCCASHFVHSCQQYCSALLHLIAGWFRLNNAEQYCWQL